MPTPEFRPLNTAERPDVLALWANVFGATEEYFERYFTADPWFEEGDTVGAWVDGELASLAHLCRRPLHWHGETLWCGGLANVATLPSYRCQGLSRALLTMLLNKMEQEKMAFSMLFTGCPLHYTPLGWEPIALTEAMLTLSPAMPACSLTPEAPRPDRLPSALYHHLPFDTLQLIRPEPYFHRWVGTNWAWGHLDLLILPGRGYVAVRACGSEESPAQVVEWRAVDDATEAALLTQAALWAGSLGAREIHYLSWLSHSCIEALANLGTLQYRHERMMMLRPIYLPEEKYQEIVMSYVGGHARWWLFSDGF